MEHADGRRHDGRCRASRRAAALSHGGRRDRRPAALRQGAGPGRAGAALWQLRDHSRGLHLPRGAGPQGLDRQSAELACPGLGAAPCLESRSRDRSDLQRQRQRQALLGALRRERPTRPQQRGDRAAGAVAVCARGAIGFHAAAVDGGARARGRRAAALAGAERLPAAQARDLRYALPRAGRRL